MKSLWCSDEVSAMIVMNFPHYIIPLSGPHKALQFFTVFFQILQLLVAPRWDSNPTPRTIYSMRQPLNHSALKAFKNYLKLGFDFIILMIFCKQLWLGSRSWLHWSKCQWKSDKTRHIDWRKFFTFILRTGVKFIQAYKSSTHITAYTYDHIKSWSAFLYP